MIQAQEIELKKLTPNKGQIEGVPTNPRKATKRAIENMKKSIEETPLMLEVNEMTAYDNNGELVVIRGNLRYKALKALGYKTAPVKVLPTETSKETVNQIVIKDNIHYGEWDPDCLQTEWEKGQLKDWGVDVSWGEEEKPKKGKEEEPDDDLQEKIDYYAMMLGDRLYDSDNEYDIPNLLMEQQPERGLLLPFAAWGADSRLRKDIATYCFYVEDYRFEAIWKDPTVVINSGCAAVVEPNLSLFDTTPIAFGLQQIYKKRWIARYYQECGIKVYADLNVARKFQKYNMLGIPKGYNAFATRGYTDRIEYLLEEIEVAKQISGLEKPNMIVYGGGAKIEQVAKENGLIYVEQFMQNKGR
jgi:hypothetical protein